MHILQIIHGYPPHYNAGSEIYTQSICHELSKNHKISLFFREENPYLPEFNIRKEIQHENLCFYIVNMAQGKDGFRHAVLDEKFANLVAEICPDIAHIGHLSHLSTGIVDKLSIQKIPIIFTLHDFWLACPRGQFLQRNSDGGDVWQLCHGQENRKCAKTCYSPYFSGINDEEDEIFWTKWVEKRMNEMRQIAEKVALFIAPSNYLRNRFMTDFGVKKDKILYLDYGFPAHNLKNYHPKAEKRHFTFGYIGTHIPAKGVNLLIEAFSKIEKKAVLKIFGRQSGQSSISLHQYAQKSKNEIQFMGEYRNENLAEVVFSTIDCIVVPSIWAENSPLVIHEAQVCKIPVITANFGGMKEYVSHGVNGLLFEHRNPSSLHEQLNFALENPSLMQKLGQKAYLYSENGGVPSIWEHCEKLVSLYQSILEKNGI